MYFRININVYLNWFTKLLKTAIIGSIVCYLLYTLLSVDNEKLTRSPKVYLWSNLSLIPNSKCRLPLHINPYNNTVKQFIVDDGVRRLVCAHENITFEWTYVDNYGIY